MYNKAYLRFSWATLIVVFLVILAGSLVRMTGSGMGCPDWPRCFGYLIPPTDESQVLWQGDKEYFKGQMIVHNDVLYSSKSDFKSASSFKEGNWEEYTEHDYAQFNATHTWIEYINRLVGALSGLFVLLLFGWTIREKLKQRVGIAEVIWAFLLIPLLGFQAWLGKTVVDSNLAPAKITAHMFGALAIVAVLLWLIRQVSRKKAEPLTTSFWLTSLAFLLVMVQIYMGTQVRQEVDIVAKSFEGLQRHLWMAEIAPELIFKVHRSFAWVILGIIGFLLWKVKQVGIWRSPHSWIAIILLLEVIAGISLSYMGMPALAQPLHLMLASILFSLLFWLLIAPKARRV